MSDQPKPRKQDAATPTTGEWTAELHHPSCSPHDRDLIWFCSQCGAKESAEEWHNAALAAERKEYASWRINVNEEHRKEIQQLRSRLAAAEEAQTKIVEATAHLERDLAAAEAFIVANQESLPLLGGEIDTTALDAAIAEAVENAYGEYVKREQDSCLKAIAAAQKPLIEAMEERLILEQKLDEAKETINALVGALKDTNCLLMSVSGEMHEQAMAQVMDNNAALANAKEGK